MKFSGPQTIEIALRLHSNGQLVDAEAAYRDILRIEPNQPDCLHMLGVLAGQRGQRDQAILLVAKAVELRPNYFDAWMNLGNLEANNGDLPGAAVAYAKASELQPANPNPWLALGIVLRSQGELHRALTAFERALRCSPVPAEAYIEAGNILRGFGQFEAAIANHSKAILLSPASPDAHNSLGNALLDAGRIDEAVAAYIAAIKLNAACAIFHINLGNALARQERHDDAQYAYNYGLDLEPNNLQGLIGKGKVLAQLRHFDSAEPLFKRALALAPEDVGAHEALAELYLETHQMVGAEAAFRRVLELQPSTASAWIGLGTALNSLGRFDEAAESLRHALEIDPANAIAFKTLAVSGSISEPEVERLTTLLQQSDLSDEHRVAAGFALGKLLDDSDRFDEAFMQYSDANRLFKRIRDAVGDRFNAADLTRQVDEITSTFNPGFFEQRRAWGDPSETPVFIVGMPRSGTTLVEQISASHSQVFGAGELSDITIHAATVGSDASLWQPDVVSRISHEQRHRLSALAPAALRVIDKMPSNLFHLGLIATIFPNARVIFCARDPRDNCLSCYFQWFAKNHLMFSYDLADCATQYLEQKRLTAHWLKVLPLRQLTVQYEELVGDLEGQSKRLIQFLGLEWEPGCLEFHKTERTVRTASVWQVRQPIYTGSIGRWKHYMKHLEPLIEMLDRNTSA